MNNNVLERHHGEIVERAVRRSEISITELARRIRTNRRSLYNWFRKPVLSDPIINRIGKAIGYDFSIDFPHIKEYEESRTNEQSKDAAGTVRYWKEKYIVLLESYNNQLQSRFEKSRQNVY